MARLAHQVFFTLKDRTDEATQKLIAECREYLTGHDGLVDFAVGQREADYQRPVNADYDVALHTVFADRPAHDAYQIAPRHLTFVERNKQDWATVRVFDSNLID